MRGCRELGYISKLWAEEELESHEAKKTSPEVPDPPNFQMQRTVPTLLRVHSALCGRRLETQAMGFAIATEWRDACLGRTLDFFFTRAAPP